MAMQWYVIHTFSAHEDKVKRIIDKEKTRWPEQDHVGEVKVPTLGNGRTSWRQEEDCQKEIHARICFH